MDRYVALAGFDLGDVALGYPGPAGQFPARHVAHQAHGAQALAEPGEKVALGTGQRPPVESKSAGVDRLREDAEGDGSAVCGDPVEELPRPPVRRSAAQS